MPIRRAVVSVVVLVVAALAGYLVTVSMGTGDPAGPSASATVPAPVAGATALPSAPPTPAAAPAPTPAGLSRALGTEVHDPALGGRLLARVIDASTGTVLYDSGGSTPAAPASTAKLLTTAAILTVHKPTDRFTTRVVAGASAGTVVLVGGGDPTLTAAAPGRAGTYGGAARVSDLAAQLQKAHVHVRSIVVDSSLFAAPAVSPDWAPEDVPSEYASAITALMVDGGRTGPSDYLRTTDTAAAAGRALAARLGDPNLPVTAGRAPAGAKQLAAVQSAPLSTLVEEMLHTSDNVIAEVLARQVALAQHRTASFLGAAAAIRAVLARLGVTVGSGMRDGSGLSAKDRVSPAALAAVLRLMSGGARSSAPGVRDALSALPVAGWSGTLGERFGAGPTHVAVGRVRAKTGTLTGVSSLAGVVRDTSGRLLVFALDADRAPPGASHSADAALDRIASTLAGCGCR